MDAELLGHRKSGEESIHARADKAVDVACSESGIGQRVPRGRGHDFVLGPAGRLAASREAHARNRHRATHILWCRHRGYAGVNSTTRASPSEAMRANTFIPILTAVGSTPTTRLIMRGPSARSISATL